MKEILCIKMEQILQKLDTRKSEIIKNFNPNVGVEGFTLVSEDRNSYRFFLKQYRQTAKNGNRTSLMSSTSVCGDDPNETVIDIGNGATENLKKNVEVFSKYSATD